MVSSETWVAMSALGTLGAALAAWWTVRIESSARAEERGRRRPYFTVSEPGIKDIGEAPSYRIQISFENVGVNPASAVIGRILFVTEDLDTAPGADVQFSLANDVPVDTPTPWYHDGVQLAENMPPHYVIAYLSYRDALTGTSHEQFFYMRWHGVEDGTTHPDFVHVDMDTAGQLDEYIMERGLEDDLRP